MISRRAPTLNPDIYRFTDLMADSVALACASTHPLASNAEVALSQCIEFPWIVPPPKNRVRMELETLLRDLGSPLPLFVGALSLEFSQEMIEDARCLWLLPRSVALDLSRRRHLHVLPLQLDLSAPPLAAIWRRERTSTQQIREFTSVLTAVIDPARPS